MVKVKQYLLLCIVSENSYVTLSVCQTCSPVLYMAQDLIRLKFDSHATAFSSLVALKNLCMDSIDLLLFLAKPGFADVRTLR